MSIIALIFLFLFFGGFLLALLAYGWRAKFLEVRRIANINAGLWGEEQTERHEVELHAAQLTGALEKTEKAYEDMKRIANEALKVAHKQEFPKIADGEHEIKRIWVDNQEVYDSNAYLPDPDPYEVKNCPQCFVSLRATEWPQRCPTCKSFFGDELDADLISD